MRGGHVPWRYLRQPSLQYGIGRDHADAGEERLPAVGVLTHEEPAWRAVVEAEGQALGPEEREQRHGDGATLDGAEHGAVEGERRLQHDADPVATGHALTLEHAREARRPLGEGPERVLLAMA